MTETSECRIDNCKRPYRAKGYCTVHYRKWRGGELPHTRYKTCTEETCRKRRFARGVCEEHYKARFGKKDTAAPAPAPVPAPAETPAPASS